MSALSEQIRRDFAAGDAIRDAGLITPDDIARYDDISYGDDGKYNLLDVYLPKEEGDALLPVIAIVHGGAWVYGDKGVYQYYGMNLAKRGFAVVNFSYRLAPENKFPAQLEDISQAFVWIGNNAQKYGFDTNKVFAVGDSAGAHLLGLYASFITNAAYRQELREKYSSAHIRMPDIKLEGVALNCGKYDLERGQEDDPNTPVIMGDFLSEKGSRKELDLTNVTRNVTALFPSAFIMTCPGDFLKNQAPLMVDALMKNNVPFEFKFYGNEQDPLHHVFHCNIRLKAGQDCNDDECDFFRRLLEI